MGETELFISGIGISRGVLATIVTMAAEKVEGVARVGGNDIASSLVSVFTSRSVAPGEAVESSVEDGALKVTVHLAVFYGYPFTRLASVVREAVATAVLEQVGIPVGSVDVCIDSLVFPKE
ncbi:Asp23/Gls24 family envelope stress response protein [Olsenella urininfantis]|uniref:Asp23/Gls24 family envelope stress response protein n=1 Tax=Olsenella urininfantis TaxID=1871033 RepID=UPI00098434FF|nr:Asp23/Gls24 family envelope stress response protein [Olsenella urininfantis]